MKLALLLWLTVSMTAATLAASKCSHLQLGILFVLLTAAPITIYAWCRSLTQKRKPRTNHHEKPQSIILPEEKWDSSRPSE